MKIQKVELSINNVAVQTQATFFKHKVSNDKTLKSEVKVAIDYL